MFLTIIGEILFKHHGYFDCCSYDLPLYYYCIGRAIFPCAANAWCYRHGVYSRISLRGLIYLDIIWIVPFRELSFTIIWQFRLDNCGYLDLLCDDCPLYRFFYAGISICPDAIFCIFKLELTMIYSRSSLRHMVSNA